MNKQERLISIINHPDFSVIEEVIEDYLKPLLDMKDIDLSQDAGTVKGEMQARLKMNDCLRRMLIDIGILRKQLEKTKPSYK